MSTIYRVVVVKRQVVLTRAVRNLITNKAEVSTK